MRCLQELHPLEETDSAARGRGAYLVALTTSGTAVFDRLALTAGLAGGDKVVWDAAFHTRSDRAWSTGGPSWIARVWSAACARSVTERSGTLELLTESQASGVPLACTAISVNSSSATCLT
jgi:hypothetical protein